MGVCLLVLIGGAEVQAQDHAHGADAPTAAAEPIVIEIAMGDHYFDPSDIRIPADEPVTLIFENSGSVPHEFMAGSGPSDGDFEVDLFGGIDVTIGPEAPPAHEHAHGEEHGTMVMVPVGSRMTMSFVLPSDRRGEWEIACFVGDHYERGMKGTLTVY